MALAPEWRFDPLTGRRVLISPDRAERPIRPTGDCPFCEGHESETPPEVLAFRDPGTAPNGPGWRVRVVPNRYAAVRLPETAPPYPPPLKGEHGCGGGPANASEQRAGASTHLLPLPLQGRGPGGGVAAPGLGVAEVVLECPHHEIAFRKLPETHIAEVIRSWRDRLRFWRADGRLAFAQVFKNEGPAAGASVEHCHSQLIGLPFVPPLVAEELRLAGPGCVFCGWVAAELGGPLHVTQSPRFAVLSPPAPRFPGETWVLPKTHAPAFEDLSDEPAEPAELAGVLRDLLCRVDQAFGGPDFNLIVKSAPFRPAAPFHWRIEVLPRTISAAGWEWGTGVVINTLFPERAAALLRAAGP